MVMAIPTAEADVSQNSCCSEIPANELRLGCHHDWDCQ